MHHNSTHHLSFLTGTQRMRTGNRPICSICSEVVIATQVSAFLAHGRIGHLWSCESCGYAFVTEHVIAANAPPTMA